jgi:hypothetical protein
MPKHIPPTGSAAPPRRDRLNLRIKAEDRGLIEHAALLMGKTRRISIWRRRVTRQKTRCLIAQCSPSAPPPMPNSWRGLMSRRTERAVAPDDANRPGLGLAVPLLPPQPRKRRGSARAVMLTILSRSFGCIVRPMIAGTRDIASARTVASRCTQGAER